MSASENHNENSVSKPRAGLFVLFSRKAKPQAAAKQAPDPDLERLLDPLSTLPYLRQTVEDISRAQRERAQREMPKVKIRAGWPRAYMRKIPAA